MELAVTSHRERHSSALSTWGDTKLVVDVLPNRPDLLSAPRSRTRDRGIDRQRHAVPDIGVNDIEVPDAKRFRRAGNAGGIVLHSGGCTIGHAVHGHRHPRT